MVDTGLGSLEPIQAGAVSAFETTLRTLLVPCIGEKEPYALQACIA